jgi:exodeoxyribonuclease VII small subunit
MTQPQPTPDTTAGAEDESFETSLAALEKIVHTLEDGQQGLSQSLEQYERGIQHLKRCNTLLESAEQKIELLMGVNERGEAITEPFESTAGASLDAKAGTKQRRRGV